MPLTPPTLQTARLRLRPFAPADAEAIYQLQSNPRVLRYWDSPPWTDRSRADRFLATCKQMEEEGTGTRLALEGAPARDFLGWCCLVGWNPDFRSASLGYCLQERAWGQGFAVEASAALLDWGFAALDLNRVQAETDTRNLASARVLEKLGFQREGTLRENCVVDGEVSDSWIYGLLARDRRGRPA